MKKQKGQAILILILIMTVALAIGVSIIQKSLVDVSTSTKIEQSTRAFSAAEAGIEKVLKENAASTNVTEINFTENQSNASAQITQLLPYPGSISVRQEPLEFPALGKETIVQVWLADPEATLPTCDSPSICYTQPTLDVYWGNSTIDRAALELTLIYYDSSQSKYATKKWYLDHPTTRNPVNNFDTVGCVGSYMIGSNKYVCKVTLGSNSGVTPDPAYLKNGTLPASGAMLIRARFLYNNDPQPFAVWATEACEDGCSLPRQVRIAVSTGFSGQSQRKLKVQETKNVVPPYFDYAIFSAGPIDKI